MDKSAILHFGWPRGGRGVPQFVGLLNQQALFFGHQPEKRYFLTNRIRCCEFFDYSSAHPASHPFLKPFGKSCIINTMFFKCHRTRLSHDCLKSFIQMSFSLLMLSSELPLHIKLNILTQPIWECWSYLPFPGIAKTFKTEYSPPAIVLETTSVIIN